jgi:hypothetical protein
MYHSTSCLRNGRLLPDPRVFSHRGIELFRIRSSERRNEISHLADWFSACLSSKEGVDLQCLRDHRNSWAPGQMFNSFSKGVALTAVSIAGVRITLSRITTPQHSISDRSQLVKVHYSNGQFADKTYQWTICRCFLF